MIRSNTLNLRKRPRISYYEPQEPNLDEYIFCTDCGDFVYDYCSIHGPLLVVPDDKVPTKHSVPAIVPRAALTVPHVFLHLARSVIPGAGIGVFTTLTLPRGVRFGPYRGQRNDQINSMYCWQIYDNDNRASHVVDAGDPRRSNWMRYVNCSRHWCEQNLIAYQYRGQIYYRTTRIIPRFTELLVFYGSEFANRLGVDLKRYNAPTSFAEKLGTTKSIKSTPVKEKIVPSPSDKQQYNFKYSQKNLKSEIISKNLLLDKSNKTVRKQHRGKSKNLINKHATNKESGMSIKNTTDLKPSYTKAVELNLHNGVNKPSKTMKSIELFELNSNNLISGKDSVKGPICETLKAVDKVILNDNMTRAPVNSNPETIKVHKYAVNKTISCEICPYETYSEKYLNSHLRAHAADISFPCDKCHYKTIKLNNLKIHNRIHSGEKPYSCTVCNKAFNHQSTLKYHLRIHSGEKPYSCTVCNKAFNDQTNLKRHLRIHSGEKPYSCTVCNKAFNLQSTLKYHLRIHSTVSLRYL